MTAPARGTFVRACSPARLTAATSLPLECDDEVAAWVLGSEGGVHSWLGRTGRTSMGSSTSSLTASPSGWRTCSRSAGQGTGGTALRPIF